MKTEASIARAILFEPLIPAAKRRPDLPRALQAILERGKPMGSSQLARFVSRVTAAAPAAPLSEEPTEQMTVQEQQAPGMARAGRSR